MQRVQVQRGKVQRVKVQREVMICHQPKQSASARTSNAVTTCMIVLLFCRFVVLLSSLRASAAGGRATAGRPPPSLKLQPLQRLTVLRNCWQKDSRHAIARAAGAASTVPQSNDFAKHLPNLQNRPL